MAKSWKPNQPLEENVCACVDKQYLFHIKQGAAVGALLCFSSGLGVRSGCVGHRRGILEAVDAASSKMENGQGSSERRRVVWDEANLAKNEAEKVPRMKIDEPETPYMPPYVGDSDDEEDELPELSLDDAADSLGEDRHGASGTAEVTGDISDAFSVQRSAAKGSVGGAAFAAGDIGNNLRFIAEEALKRRQRDSDAELGGANKVGKGEWDDDDNDGGGATGGGGKGAGNDDDNVKTPVRKDFELRRKIHYDEGHRLKAMLARGGFDDDDDNDDDDKQEEVGGGSERKGEPGEQGRLERPQTASGVGAGLNEGN